MQYANVIVVRVITVIVEEAELGEDEPAFLPQLEAIAALFEQPATDGHRGVRVPVADHGCLEL